MEQPARHTQLLAYLEQQTEKKTISQIREDLKWSEQEVITSLVDLSKENVVMIETEPGHRDTKDGVTGIGMPRSVVRLI